MTRGGQTHLFLLRQNQGQFLGWGSKSRGATCHEVLLRNNLSHNHNCTLGPAPPAVLKTQVHVSLLITSRPFAASSGKTDLSPVYPKLVIVILGVREKIFSTLKGH